MENINVHSVLEMEADKLKIEDCIVNASGKYYSEESVIKILDNVITESAKVCKIYFDIASKEIGEEETRKQRDEIINSAGLI